MPNFNDITGLRYGKLVATNKTNKTVKGNYVWECVCDCGNTIHTRSAALVNGSCTSCGCLTSKKKSEALRGHGMTKTPTYKSWQMMKARCLCPNYDDKGHYKSRGITICNSWVNSFETFLRDMRPRPSDTSLDRIDVNGNYEPSNCRWATRSTQSINTRRIKQPGVIKVNHKWRAIIKRNKANKHLGYFNTEQEAVAARKGAEIEHSLAS